MGAPANASTGAPVMTFVVDVEAGPIVRPRVLYGELRVSIVLPLGQLASQPLCLLAREKQPR
jgi:hypothetical protein